MMIAKAAALFEVPASAPTSLTASITDTLASPGALAFIVFVAALPLIFWVINKLLDLFPDDFKRRSDELGAGIKNLEKGIARNKDFYRDASNFAKEFGKIGK